MRFNFKFSEGAAAMVALSWLLFSPATPAIAQLRITEVMYNTLGPEANNDTVWEWIEVQNLGADIDLDGAFLDGLNDIIPAADASPNISSTFATNTMIPAGGVAVLYDGFHGQDSPLSYNDQIFRDAWGLNANVPMIAVDFWPGLANSSGNPDNMSIGIWANREAYNMDITGNPGEGTVTSFANTLASVNYDVAAPWPSNMGGVSIQYSGAGDIADGGNWAHSSVDDGATTSVAASVIGSINSTSDAGNPGLHFGGSAPDGQLLITEVMFNPRSDETAGPDFEWIEVLNTTGATIDFSVTPYYFDDAAGGNLAEPNVTLGSIADLETAVLFSDGLLSIEDMEGIWGDTINFIPVSNWGALNNGTGDTVGLWDNQTAYAADEETGEEGVRGVTMAVASVVYRTDDTGGWPVPDGNGSIWLTDLSDDPTNGANWVVAAENDGFGISYNAMAIGDMVEIHPGGDIGSPGSFAMDPGGDVLGDYNEDGIVNAADYIVWRNNEGQNFALPNERPDASTPGVPDQEDYLYWVSQFGSTSGAASGSAAVPEPTAALLCVIAILGLSTTRSRRR